MKWYWQVYAGLILSTGYGQMLRKLLTDTGGFSSRYGAATVATILVVILIAKARHAPLWRAWPWQVFFALLCLGGLVAGGFGVYLSFKGVYLTALLLGLTLLLLLPAYHPVYVYAFRSPGIWGHRTSHAGDDEH